MKNKFHIPKGRFGRAGLSLLITAVVGFVYFYISLPALNLQSEEFYQFISLLSIVYLVSAFLMGGLPHDNVVRSPKEKLLDWLGFVKKHCLTAGIVFLLSAVIIPLVGQVISAPLFRAGAYRDLLTVQTGSFTQDVAQISFDEIPTLDRTARWAR